MTRTGGILAFVGVSGLLGIFMFSLISWALEVEKVSVVVPICIAGFFSAAVVGFVLLYWDLFRS